MNPDPSTRPPSSGGAWTAAIIVVAISVLSTFTLSKSDNTSVSANGQSGANTPGKRIVQTQKGAGSSDPSGASVSGSGSSVGGGSTGGGSDSSGAGPGDEIVTVDEEGNIISTEPAGGGGTSGGAGGSSSSSGGGTAATGGAGPVVVNGTTYDCAKNQNAGASDTGVSASAINFAATVVKTGIAKDFLSDAQFGIEAVRQKVNRAGGVCGRLINIKYDDDGWNPSTGNQLIEKYIGSKSYFGLAVNPSSEGLRFAIDNGVIKNNQFPVVGADGMLIDQYKDPWVWPVATSTHSVMHIMATDAKARGAGTFGIVWDNNYRFGVEGQKAFVGAVSRMGGTVIDAPVQGGQTSYKTQVNSFIGKCSTSGTQDLKKCDYIALLLEPATAEQWVRDGGLGNGKDRPKVGFGAPQPLFVTSFARDCGGFCANMRVWTSFKPPIPPFDSDPAVATYRSDLGAVSSTADASNPHVEGAYVGMQLLVEALRKLGPAPTRVNLQATLDAMSLDTGLTPALTFAAGDHFAATSAQAFEAIYNVGSFVNWRYTNSGFVADHEVNQDL